MSLKRYLARVFYYISHGVPVKNIYPQIDLIQFPESLEGRCAFITGGTSGIGYEIAKAFVNSGAKIVITGRNYEKVKIACEKIEYDCQIKHRVFGIEMNNLEVSSFEKCVDKAENLIGKIDILVNNAGIGGGDFSTIEEIEYDKVMNTNLKANFFLSRIIANRMIANSISGNILNIASSSSLRPANSAYVLSKWGVRSLTEGLALSLIPHNIVVNGIAPGPTATPMLHKEFSPDKSLTRLDNPMGRYVLPQEIARMAVVLVSNMSRSIVGDIVYMTGGAGNLFNSDFEYKL